MAVKSDFDPYLLPGEVILWSAISQPDPSAWKAVLWRVVAGIVLLSLFAPDAYALIALCIKAGDLFPVQFIGVLESAKRLGGAGSGLWLVWWGASLWRKPQSYSFALSERRVFGTLLWRRDRLTTASFVDPRGTLAVTSLGGLSAISVPIQQTGEDDAYVSLSHLSPDDHRAAIAVLNRIFVK